jgi:hypothetical protein
LEEAVIEYVVGEVLSERNLLEIQKTFIERLSEDIERIGPELKRNEVELIRMERSKRNVVRAIEEMGGSEELYKRLRELEREAASMRALISQLQKRREAPPMLTEGELLQVAASMRRILVEADLDERRRILAGFITYLRVDRRDAEIMIDLGYTPPYEGPAPPDGGYSQPISGPLGGTVLTAKFTKRIRTNKLPTTPSG